MLLQLPLPPIALRQRIEVPSSGMSPDEAYLEAGIANRLSILDCLPGGWTWEGKRVLDFGCGAGGTLRHFGEEATKAEFWGCDVDAPSVQWCRQTLFPPMTFVLNRQVPPLGVPSGHFDLIYAISVFNHITTHWAAWLLELHRLAAPNGLLVISFVGEGATRHLAAEPANDNNFGMTARGSGSSWSQGEQTVLRSPWWIREHWGRLFSIERLDARGFAESTSAQGVVVMRRTQRLLDLDELERPNTAEPREALALYQDVLEQRVEDAWLRQELETERAARLSTEQQLSAAVARHRQEMAAIGARHQQEMVAIGARHQQEVIAIGTRHHQELSVYVHHQGDLLASIAHHQEQLSAMRATWSWRLTAPMRAAWTCLKDLMRPFSS